MTDELQRVKDFRAAEPPASEEAQRAARAALRRLIAAEAPRGAVVRRRKLRLRGLAVVVAAAAAVAVIGIFGSAGSPSSAAAAVLERLARVIATQSLTPHRGQYLYTDSRSMYPAVVNNMCETLAPKHRQIWIGANGAGLLRETAGRPTFTSAHDRAVCQSMPGFKAEIVAASGTSNMWFAPGCLALGPTNHWRRLSTDPNVLLHQMRKIDGGPPTAAEDFVHIGDFLREADAPPRIRAAIYRAAALIPGVQLLGPVRDHDGRTGIGMAYTAHKSTSELIFDPQTGELLGEQGTGPLHYWAVYLRQRVVNQLPSPSPAPLTPACIATAGHVRHTPKGDVVTGIRPVPGGLRATSP
jgi:hypothetical protein